MLENLRAQIANRWQHIVAELRSYGDSDLSTFLEESGIELSDIAATWQPFLDEASPRRRAADASGLAV
jgi:hypothetical protein